MAQSASPIADGTPTDTSRVLPDDAVIEETTAGGLVYEPIVEDGTRVGRRLIGFVVVQSWQGIRDELRNRGKGTGASRHLPVFDRA